MNTIKEPIVCVYLEETEVEKEQLQESRKKPKDRVNS